MLEKYYVLVLSINKSGGNSEEITRKDTLTDAENLFYDNVNDNCYLISRRIRRYSQRAFSKKTQKTLFEIFGTLCLCSAIVMNLPVSKLPPSSCQYHNISFRYQSFQKEKH